MAAERLLITGATGFVGTAAARFWRDRRPDVEVWGTSERPGPGEFAPGRYRRVDIRDADAVRSLVDEVRPTQVLHLASLIAGNDLEAFLAVNVLGTDRLYEALAAVSPGASVVQVASAAMYGRIHGDELPISEKQPLRPVRLLTGASDRPGAGVQHAGSRTARAACADDVRASDS